MCRLLLGVTFVFSGFVKAVDPLGTFYKFQDYLSAFGLLDYLPSGLILLAAVVLAAIEFCSGAYLLLGVRRRLSSAVVLLMMIVMTPLTLYLAIANPVHDCGCFGDAVVLTNWQTFGKNVVLIVAAVVVFKWKLLMPRLVTLQTEWIVVLYTLLFVFCLAGYCLRTLPVLDFRPYRVGTDMRQAMSMDEGRVPTIQDFYIEDRETGDDLTDSLLNDTSYSFLMVANRIESADDGYIDLINEIYDYSVEHGYSFYALTSSGDEDIELWSDRTGAEYTFYLADEVTLKTIIRTNPGLLLLHDGVIFNKWCGSRLPDEYQLTGPLDEIAAGSPETYSTAGRMCRVLLWFFGPLIVFIALDLAFVRRRGKKILNPKT